MLAALCISAAIPEAGAKYPFGVLLFHCSGSESFTFGTIIESGGAGSALNSKYAQWHRKALIRLPAATMALAVIFIG
jgi:hypothetical protein